MNYPIASLHRNLSELMNSMQKVEVKMDDLLDWENAEKEIRKYETNK